MNKVTLSISIFSIWSPISEAIDPFLNFLGLFVRSESFVGFDEYDPWWYYLFHLFVLTFQFLLSILQFLDPLVDRLNLLLTVLWKVILIYFFFFVLR